MIPQWLQDVVYLLRGVSWEGVRVALWIWAILCLLTALDLWEQEKESGKR